MKEKCLLKLEKHWLKIWNYYFYRRVIVGEKKALVELLGVVGEKEAQVEPLDIVGEKGSQVEPLGNIGEKDSGAESLNITEEVELLEVVNKDLQSGVTGVLCAVCFLFSCCVRYVACCLEMFSILCYQHKQNWPYRTEINKLYISKEIEKSNLFHQS